MKVDQAAYLKSIALGRLITLSQWDGSAMRTLEREYLQEKEEKPTASRVPCPSVAVLDGCLEE